MNPDATNLTALCPECHETVTFHPQTPPGYLLLCPHCETILMVTAVQPLQIDWAFEEPTGPDKSTIPISTKIPYWHWHFSNSYR